LGSGWAREIDVEIDCAHDAAAKFFVDQFLQGRNVSLCRQAQNVFALLGMPGSGIFAPGLNPDQVPVRQRLIENPYRELLG
jgi:hypothetical protein